MTRWVRGFVRFGYVTKGVVYALIGWLATQAAIGAGGKTTDSHGAVREISREGAPFSAELVLLIAAGLAIYAAWRIIEAALDLEHRGSSLLGIITRAGYAAGGVSYALLAFYAAKVGVGWHTGGDEKKAITSKLLATEWGPWVIGIVGVSMIGAGIYQLLLSVRGTFMHDYQTGKMSRTSRRFARVIGSFGLAARAITFFIIGTFAIRAAERSNAGEIKGLGEALRLLATQSEGKVLFAIVAVGLVAYGLYCFSNAFYRRFAI